MRKTDERLRSSPANSPLYIENMERGDFSIYHWPSSGGADLTTTMQQTYNENPRIGELIRTQDFRIALSHTVDKEVLNTVVLSGVGVVQNRVPRPNNPYYPGDEFRMLHMEKDLNKANQMLDALAASRGETTDRLPGPQGRFEYRRDADHHWHEPEPGRLAGRRDSEGGMAGRRHQDDHRGR